ncbi:GAF domain-containing protein [Mycolicibacterium fortuitum]|uniref:GAF domain-containing protein n=1 Tax=Mycolicibacterium fortuitum TaxID=1766 RepID=UPI001CE03D20|nr:GAF domain-containing protein [Mycolicibacterium fortuitum]MCA4726609.1 transposase [Mycolicibacterium fortuitum]
MPSISDPPSTTVTGSRDLTALMPAIADEARKLVGARFGQIVRAGETAGQRGRQPASEISELVGETMDGLTAVRRSNFLGVPIRISGHLFAVLYLTDPIDRHFGVEDEELICAFAANAGVTIQNALWFNESRLRQSWLEACAEIAGQLLSDDDTDPLALIAQRVLQCARADLVNVVVPAGDEARLVVEVAIGDGAQGLTGRNFPMANTLSSLVIQTGEPVSIGALRNQATQSEYGAMLCRLVPLGPVMAIPLGGLESRSALIVGRHQDRDRFSVAEETMATMFANYAALGLELAQARTREQAAALLEDRSRIARDLHDHVIQRLYAAGLTTQRVSATVEDRGASARLSAAVDEIDAIIDHIRTTIVLLRELPRH